MPEKTQFIEVKMILKGEEGSSCLGASQSPTERKSMGQTVGKAVCQKKEISLSSRAILNVHRSIICNNQNLETT